MSPIISLLRKSHSLKKKEGGERRFLHWFLSFFLFLPEAKALKMMEMATGDGRQDGARKKKEGCSHDPFL